MGETTFMITANQLRAARALLNIDQRQMADLADLSVPTIQRMEASDGVIRANVDSLMKLVSALENAGIELINPGVTSPAGGRGVRLREHVMKPKMKTIRQPKLSSSRTSERARDRKSTRLNSSHTEIYTLSLHDALPISAGGRGVRLREHVMKPKMKTIRQPKLSSSRTSERA